MKKKFRFGKAFPDKLKKVAFKYGHFHGHKESNDWQDQFIPGVKDGNRVTSPVSEWRRFSFLIILICFFSLLFFKLFHLQIAQGRINRDLADSNRIQVKVIHAPRGVIYDRNGKILAQNEPGFRLIEKAKDLPRARLITRDEFLKMEISGSPDLKNLELDSIRTYPMGEKTAHILGYVGEISPEELKEQSDKNYGENQNGFLARSSAYKLGDKLGRMGIEQYYEKILRGIDGGEIIEVDAQGNKVRTLSETKPVAGQNLILSIDASLQEIAYKQLSDATKKTGSCCGALVTQEPKSGQILAMVSLPSFDPSDILNSLTAPNSPILNRAISGTYPPGSTFKISSALAGLSSGKITEKTEFEDTGVINLGPFTFANWYFTEYGRKEAGGVNIVRALQRSNDIFFYRLGQAAGEQSLSDAAKKLGLGKKLGIDIPGEETGLIPDNDWKVKNTGEIWYPGDTLHMAIGQGYVLVTPLQISNLISTVASDGKEFPPHFALKITNDSNQTVKEYKYDPLTTKDFKQSDIQLVKKGLSLVPKNGGTAWPFFTFPIETAGKTGTAEFGDPKNRTHAWYTAYAPEEDPIIAITVLVEAAGEGSTVASPIVKELFRWYFSPDKNNLIKDLGPIATDSARTLGE